MCTAAALHRSDTNSHLRCSPDATTDQSRQEPTPVGHRLLYAQQDADSVGCGVSAIVYVLRLLRNNRHNSHNGGFTY